MLDPFQGEVMTLLAANRSEDSFVAGGAALNRDGPRLSRDVDVFHRTVALLDAAVAADLATLRAAGYDLRRDRETSTSREWTVAGAAGRATKLQWTRDTSWLFLPPLRDETFGYVLSFEDLATNKLLAAADRGRVRDFHDLAALDLAGVDLWLLALAAMGKDADTGPVAVLERARRHLSQAGADDEDPDYAGPPVPWPLIRAHVRRRLEDALVTLDAFRWVNWAGRLALDPGTGRLPLRVAPADLGRCRPLGATPQGAWPTSPAVVTDMLRRARHPGIARLPDDLRPLLDREAFPET